MKNLSTDCQVEKFRGGNSKHFKLLWDTQEMGQFDTLSQARVQTSDSSRRIGVFRSTPATVGCIACGVKGVLDYV